MATKFYSCLTPLSLRSPVNLLAPIFSSINPTETMTNLIIAWKFNQKWLQESLFLA